MGHDQMNPLRNIARRAKEIGEQNDLRMLDARFAPALIDGANDRVLIAFEYDPDQVNKPEIIVTQASSHLEEAMEASQREERERRVEQARKDLSEMEQKLKGRGGFLDD